MIARQRATGFTRQDGSTRRKLAGPTRVLGNGIYRRDFAGGVVVVNPPAASAAQTDSLGATFVDLDGVSRTSVTLAPGQARVLRR